MEDLESMVHLMFLLQMGICMTHTMQQMHHSRRWLPRRWWVRPLFEQRKQKGFFYTKYETLKEDESFFLTLFRMKYDKFKELLSLVRPLIEKSSPREPICPEQRLFVTLR